MGAVLGQVSLVTVDGTDFKVWEPSPFNPDYFSHKFHHAAVRYEIGICIKTGWIVWINGPFPCGAWPDLRIARDALHDSLDGGEMYVADGGYADSNGFSYTPDGTHTFQQRTYQLGRARHEGINGCFKVYKCLTDEFRHDLTKHSAVFRSVANICQIGIAAGGLTFEIEYSESLINDNL